MMESFPSYKALVLLNQLWPTPDGMNFCVYESESDFLLGHVSLAVMTNSYLGIDMSEKYSLHIKQIVVSDDLRGCGVLGVICKRLIYAAEESGAFLYGVARCFQKALPKISTSEEYLAYLEEESSGYIPSKKDEFKCSRSLLKKYLANGFCRFDGAGCSMMDRRWKKLCFGYKSTKLRYGEVARFLDKHLF